MTNPDRTKKTVQPMGTPSVPIQVYSPIPAFLTQIKTNFNGKRVLVQRKGIIDERLHFQA